MSKRNNRQCQLVLVNKLPDQAANQSQQSPQQKAARARAITFSMKKHPEETRYTSPQTSVSLREQWPVARALEYYKKGIEKYKVTFPMEVDAANGARIRITEAVPITEEGRARWIYYNNVPCLLRGTTVLENGMGSSLTYDFEELFEPQGDM